MHMHLYAFRGRGAFCGHSRRECERHLKSLLELAAATTNTSSSRESKGYSFWLTITIRVRMHMLRIHSRQRGTDEATNQYLCSHA